MIETIKSLFDFILHIDKHLIEIVAKYDNWTYLILFMLNCICRNRACCYTPASR